jgi:hypothetical protein
VDAALTSDTVNNLTNYGTLPVWHCARCNRVFGHRGYLVESEITAYSTRVCAATDLGVQQHISNRIGWDIDPRLSDLETKITTLSGEVRELQEAVKSQKDDILFSLKERVSQFTLS